MKTKRRFLVRPPREPVALDRLVKMGPQELQQLYREVFGCDVFAGNRGQARRKIAWFLQAECEGGLPESARQHALAMAKDARLRVRVSTNANRRSHGLPLEHATTTRVVSDHDSRLPMPGSILVKKYKDRIILIKVLSSGFEYDDRHFSSLSAIAHEITGTKWNGFLFFGLLRTGAQNGR